VAASALPLDVTSGPVGTQFTIHLKGTGWTETANIYTVVYDNVHTGYACGFNSQGDVQIPIQATGEPGWHFVDLYPAIYKGKETYPVSYRLRSSPMRRTTRPRICRPPLCLKVTEGAPIGQ